MLWSIKFSFSNRFLVLFKRILTFAQRQVDCFDVFLHAEFRQPKMMFNQTQHHIALPCKKISTCWLTESVCEQVAALLLSPLTLPYQRPVTFVCFRLPHARSPHNEGRPNFFFVFCSNRRRCLLCYQCLFSKYTHIQTQSSITFDGSVWLTFEWEKRLHFPAISGSLLFLFFECVTV